MQISPWTLKGWPPAYLTLDQADRLELTHLGTTLGPAGDPIAGQAIWGIPGKVALAWDWVCLQGGIVTLEHPGQIITNIRFVDDAGCVVDETASMRLINVLVHRQAWQAQVMEVLSTYDSDRTGNLDVARYRP